MKKTLLVLGILCTIIGWAQVTDVGGFPAPAVYEHGDSFTVTITNPTAQPVTFVVADKSYPVATSDSSLVDYLLQVAQQQPTMSAAKRAVADTLLSIYKSYRFVNDKNPWNAFLGDNPQESTQKLYAPTGALHGQPSRKCGNQAKQFMTVLQMTGLFDMSELHSVFISNLHEVCEIKIDSLFEVYDIDPSMPIAHVAVSAMDLAVNTTILDTAVLWLDRTLGESISSWTKEEYISLWSQSVTVQPFTMIGGMPLDIDGEITLCPGCSVTWSHVVPLFIDLTTPEGAELDATKRRVLNGLTHPNQDSLNMFVHMCAQYWNISEQEVIQKMQSGEVVVKKRTTEYLIWPSSSTSDITTVQITSPGPVSAGQLQFPGLVMNSSAKLYFTDATLSGPRQLWADEAPVVNSAEIQYCSNFTTVGPVTIDVSCNYRLYDIVNGFQINSADSLVITKEKNGLPMAMVTGISNDPVVSDWGFYPNPSSGTVIIKNNPGSLVVMDALGQIILSIPKGTNTVHLPDGILFISDGITTKKAIITR